MTDSTMPQDTGRKSVNPSALAVAELAQLLSKVGGHAITEAMIASDVTSGAPANPDGTVNLVHYAAWLAKEVVGGD